MIPASDSLTRRLIVSANFITYSQLYRTTQFGLRLETYAGDPEVFPRQGDPETFVKETSAYSLLDSSLTTIEYAYADAWPDVGPWHPVQDTLHFSDETDFIVVYLEAYENIRPTPHESEFFGAFADLVTISLDNSGYPPIARPDSISIEQTGIPFPEYIDVLRNDLDPNGQGGTGPSDLTIASVTEPPYGHIEIVGGSLGYTYELGTEGTFTLFYTVEDREGLRATAPLVMEVLPLSRPVAVSDTFVVAADTPTELDLLANDFAAHGDSISISRVSTPTTLGTITIINDDQAVRYTPPAGFSGTDTFTYVVINSNDTFISSASVVVEVDAPSANTSPVGVPDTFMVAVNTPTELNVRANDYDLDGDDFRIIASTPNTPAGGTTEPINDDLAILYTPPDGFSGTDRFNYIIRDARGGQSGETLVTVQVGSSNRAPVVTDPVNDLTVNVDPQESCSFDLDSHFADPDGDALTYTHTQAGNAATVSLSGSTLTITSNLGQTTVTVSATDPGGLSTDDSFEVIGEFSTNCGGNGAAP